MVRGVETTVYGLNQFTQGRWVRIMELIENREPELCSFDPGFGEDAIITVENDLTFAR